MENFEFYRPKSLLELSDAEIAKLSPEDQNELIELVLLESKEIIESLSRKIDGMNEEIFSLDSFYEIQSVIEEYRILMEDLDIVDEYFEQYLQSLLEKLERKNPISKVAEQNRGNVLIHSSDLTSLRNLLKLRVDVSEVCTTAGSLRKKGDIFRPKQKSIHAGLIFDPKQASAWFCKDVGSSTSRGRRVLESRFEQFRCATLDDALARQSDGRVEAWVDTQVAHPVALLLIDTDKSDEVIKLAKQYNLPVLFNSHLYE